MQVDLDWILNYYSGDHDFRILKDSIVASLVSRNTLSRKSLCGSSEFIVVNTSDGRGMIAVTYMGSLTVFISIDNSYSRWERVYG